MQTLSPQVGKPGTCVKTRTFSGPGLGIRLAILSGLAMILALFLASVGRLPILHPDSGSYLSRFAYRAPLYPAWLWLFSGKIEIAVLAQWGLAFFSIALILITRWSVAVKLSFLALLFSLTIESKTVAEWMAFYLSSILTEGLWVGMSVLLGIQLFRKPRGIFWGLLCYLPLELSPRLAVTGLFTLLPIWRREPKRFRAAGTFALLILLRSLGQFWWTGDLTPSPFGGIGTVGVIASHAERGDLAYLSQAQILFWQRVVMAKEKSAGAEAINGNTWRVAVPIYRDLFGNTETQEERRRMNAFFAGISTRLLMQKPGLALAIAKDGLRETSHFIRRHWVFWVFIFLILAVSWVAKLPSRYEVTAVVSVLFAHGIFTSALAGYYERYWGAFYPLLCLGLAVILRELALKITAKLPRVFSLFVRPIAYR